MIVFALSGKSGSGKDEVGRILVEKSRFVRYAFADALKDCALAADPFISLQGNEFMRLSILVEKEGWDEAKKHPDVRRLLQRMGTEMGREIISPTVWTDILRDKLTKDLPDWVVVTDCRFFNEVEELKSPLTIETTPFVVSIRLERDGVDPVLTHSSEDLDFIPDRVIKNNGDLSDLEEEISLILDEYPEEWTNA